MPKANASMPEAKPLPNFESETGKIVSSKG